MKILVAYASRHGSTKGIAERIAAELERHELDVDFRSVDTVESVDGFDAFVIGSAVYAGQWEKSASTFVRMYAPLLRRYPVWLFSSGPVGTETVDKNGHDVLEVTRPKQFAEFATLIRPRGEQVFFGAYDPDRSDASLAERFIVKVPAIREMLPAGDFRDWDAIDAWATDIATELRRGVLVTA